MPGTSPPEGAEAMGGDGRLLTVIMPIFNERATMRAAAERMLKTELQLPVELVVVDDGSTDGSAETVADLADGERVRVLRHRRNRGQGCRDPDRPRGGERRHHHDPRRRPRVRPLGSSELLEPMLSGDATVVYGTRSFGAHTAYSFWYVIGNKVLALWASFLFNTWLSDVETCFKMAGTSVWRDLGLRSDDFGIEAEMTGTGPAIGSPHLRGADRVSRAHAGRGQEAELDRRRSRVVDPIPDPVGRMRER